MAINLMCMNSKCKFYWEDRCTRNLMEEFTKINEDGQCTTFEEGVCDWYNEGMEVCKMIKKYNEALLEVYRRITQKYAESVLEAKKHEDEEMDTLLFVADGKKIAFHQSMKIIEAILEDEE